MKLKNSVVYLIILSTTVLLSKEPNRVEFHVSIEALPVYLNPGDNSEVTLADGITYVNFQFPKRNWFWGVTIPVFNNYRIGFDIMQLVWTSYYRHKYDVSDNGVWEAAEGLTFGKTDMLFPHWLSGPAVNISWSLNNDKSLWNNSVFAVGNFWGHGGSEGFELIPFIRIERPIINKFRHIIVVAQISNIPNDGLTTSLQIGFNSNLLFWKR